jgi:hypothetical protein
MHPKRFKAARFFCAHACTCVWFHLDTFRPCPSSGLAQAQCAAVKDLWAHIGRCPYRYRHPRPVLSTTKARARPTRHPTPFHSGSPVILILIFSNLYRASKAAAAAAHEAGRGATRRRRRRGVGDPPLARVLAPPPTEHARPIRQTGA